MDQNQKQNQEVPNTDGGFSFRDIGAFIWDLVKILVIALIIIVPFRSFVAEPFVVSGSSMLPNFQNHNYLIVARTAIVGKPKRGQVIVLLYPKDTSQFFIKRVIGLPGETICFRQGHVVISQTPITSQQCQDGQGAVLNEPYLPSQTETYSDNEPVTLGSSEYFVLGDNRTASSDSRVWGILPANDIVGNVWIRVYPFSDFGFIKIPNY